MITEFQVAMAVAHVLEIEVLAWLTRCKILAIIHTWTTQKEAR